MFKKCKQTVPEVRRRDTDADDENNTLTKKVQIVMMFDKY